MKKNFLFLLAALIQYAAIAQLNITFKSNLKFPGKQLSNIWGWKHPSDGKEYALVGHSEGMSVVNVTDPANPVGLFLAPGPNSTWREVRTKGNYAFVTTEGGGGLKIVNLQFLPDSIQTKSWMGDGAIAGQLNTIHALHVDGNFLYLYGSNIGNKGALFINVTDPWNPIFAGQFQNWYVHDGIVRNDTAYFGHINDGFFSVVKTTNKSVPVLLATQSTPNNFTHNTWLSDNSKVLFTTDEKDNSYVAAYDVSNLNNIAELDRIQHNPGSNSVPHNTYVLNDYAITSWYKEGVVIIDGSRPTNLVVTGHYDTSPLSGAGMEGDWGVYPYLPSGNLLISDMQEGLFVLTPTYRRGCYLEGSVTESGTGNSLFGVLVSIQNTTETTTSKASGNYACGWGEAGTYDVKFEKNGYVSKIINGINLSNGNVTSLNVQLEKSMPFTMTGKVIDDSTGISVPFADIRFSTNLVQIDTTADSNGNFTIPGFYGNNYDVITGKWGYRTRCFNQTITQNSGIVNIELDKGYFDDFSFDFGWTIISTASAGIWEIGKPAGTSNGGAQSNPGTDIPLDCSDQAFVTGNAGGSAGDDDIDDGYTRITSPVFDISDYQDAYISYYRWFYNGGGFGGQPNDTLKIKLTDGNTTVTIDTVTVSSPGNSSWVFKTFKISDYIPITPALRVIVEAADYNPGHLVEAAFDAFQVIDSANPPPPLSAKEMEIEMSVINLYPNPSADGKFEVMCLGSKNAVLEVYNILGEKIYQSQILNLPFSFDLSDKPAGMYFVKVQSADKKYKTIKVVKL